MRYNLGRRVATWATETICKRIFNQMVNFIGSFYMCKLCFTQTLRVFPSLSTFSVTVRFWETETKRQTQCPEVGVIVDWVDASYFP